MNEKLKGHSKSLTGASRPGLDCTDAITKLAHCRGAFSEKQLARSRRLHFNHRSLSWLSRSFAPRHGVAHSRSLVFMALYSHQAPPQGWRLVKCSRDSMMNGRSLPASKRPTHTNGATSHRPQQLDCQIRPAELEIYLRRLCSNELVS